MATFTGAQATAFEFRALNSLITEHNLKYSVIIKLTVPLLVDFSLQKDTRMHFFTTV